MRLPVPSIQRQVAPSVGQAPQARDVPQFGVQDAANSLNQVAAYREKISREQETRFLQLEHEQQKARTFDRVSTDNLKWTETFQKRVDEAPPGAEGFTPSLLKDFDTYKEQALKSVTDENERRMYDGMLTRLRENLGEKALAFESNSRRTYRKQVLADGADTDARTLSLDPGQFQEVLARRVAAINGSADLPAVEKQDLTKRSRELLSMTAAQTMVDRNPGGWLTSKPETNPVMNHLAPEHLASLNRRAQALVEHESQQDRYRLQTAAKDVQAMVLQAVAPPAGSVPTREQYIKAYGQDGALRYQEEVGSYLQLGGVLGPMQTASFAERRKMVAEATPTPGQGFALGARNAEAVKQANALLEKRIASDPAAYALQTSPRVQKAAAIMERVMNDPKMPDGDRVAAMNFYAETQMAWQQHIGVKEINDQRVGDEKKSSPLRLLTNQQANAIAAKFYDQATGGAKSAELIQSLEQQWGRHWPSVYAQLASDNKLPPAALVIPNMPNDASRARMAAVSSLKPDELKALINPTDHKDIKERLLSQFEPAQRTFTAQGADGSRTLATVLQEAEKLAMSYRAEGRSIGAAAQQAFTEVMGHRYEFKDTYRVPREANPAEVVAGAAFAHKQLERQEGLQVFTTTTPQLITSDAIRARGFWVTSGDESGLRFVVQGADGGIYAVRDKDGKPVAYEWEALRRLVPASKTPEAQKEDHVRELRERQQELNPAYNTPIRPSLVGR